MSERVPEPPERPEEDVIREQLEHLGPQRAGAGLAALAALVAAKEAAERERADFLTLAMERLDGWRKAEAERDALAEALRDARDKIGDLIWAHFPNDIRSEEFLNALDDSGALAGLNEPGAVNGASDSPNRLTQDVGPCPDSGSLSGDTPA